MEKNQVNPGMERDRGVEPLSPPWEGGIKPFN